MLSTFLAALFGFANPFFWGGLDLFIDARQPLDPSVPLLAVYQTLSPADVGRIRQRVGDINTIIQQVADTQGIPIVDIHGLLAQAQVAGLAVTDAAGREIARVNTTFTGGLFSLDGIHPSNTGQAIIANAFIDKINEQIARLGSFGGLTRPLPRVDVSAIYTDQIRQDRLAPAMLRMERLGAPTE